MNVSLQPFSDVELEDQDQMDFLRPPSKHEARTIAKEVLGNIEVPASLPVKENGVEASEKAVKKENDKEENQSGAAMQARDCAAGGGNRTEEGVNELKRKLTVELAEPPAKTPRISELSAYLSEPLVENGSSLLFWKSAERFPELQMAAKKLLSVPATSGGFDRLCPMASCIVKAKRNHLPTHTAERLLLYKNLLKTKTVKKSLTKS